MACDECKKRGELMRKAMAEVRSKQDAARFIRDFVATYRRAPTSTVPQEPWAPPRQVGHRPKKDK